MHIFAAKGLFGEGPAERRERLKNLVSRLSDDEIARKLKRKEEEEKREEESQNVRISGFSLFSMD